MFRSLALLLSLTLALAACDSAGPRLGTDGKPLPQVHRIKPSDEGKIQYRMLDSVNSMRVAAGLQPLQLNAQLNAAATTHSRDMSRQNRPWHFGSDGSSPIERAQRAGYSGYLKGEAISETFESELETLAAWMLEPGPRGIIMAPDAREMGFGFHQDSNGKIWWTLVTGGW